MSVVTYGNCLRCGQPYQVEEFTHNYVVIVAGRAVDVCPACGEDLKVAKPAPKVEEGEAEDV